VLQLEFFQNGQEIQIDSLFNAHSLHQRKNRPKIINFIKFSQNGHKESALTKKRAKKNIVVTEC